MIRFIQRIVIVLFVVSVVLLAAAAWKNASVRDTNGPAITMDTASITMSVHAAPEEILAGVKAADSKDGDVTGSLVVEGMSNFVEKGRRQATIAAFDSDNNVSKVTREVVYNDYDSPRFILEKPLRFPMNASLSPTEFFKVTDSLDGDLTGSIVMSSDDTYIDGMGGSLGYRFTVINSAGDVAELPVTIDLYNPSEDNRCPKVVLSEYLIYVKKGVEVKPWNYVEGIDYFGDTYSLAELRVDEENEGIGYTKDDIKISNPLDTNKPGTYEVIYSIENEDAYQSDVRLIVVVEE